MSGRVRHRSARAVQGPDKVTWVPIRPQAAPVEVDWAAVEELRAARRDGNHLPATGLCHDCGKRVTGERRFCGRCLARHDRSGATS